MNQRRQGLGDTWAVRYGSRRGIQVGRRGYRSGSAASVEPVKIRTSWNGPDLGNKSKAIKTGFYKERGPWVYHGNARTTAITILLSPTSIAKKSVTPGSKAWSAILNAITTGKARAITTTQFKALKENQRAGQVEARNPRATSRPTSPSYEPAASVEKTVNYPVEAKTSLIPSWAPWAAGGLVAALLLCNYNKF